MGVRVFTDDEGLKAPEGGGGNFDGPPHWESWVIEIATASLGRLKTLIVGEYPDSQAIRSSVDDVPS